MIFWGQFTSMNQTDSELYNLRKVLVYLGFYFTKFEVVQITSYNFLGLALGINLHNMTFDNIAENYIKMFLFMKTYLQDIKNMIQYLLIFLGQKLFKLNWFKIMKIKLIRYKKTSPVLTWCHDCKVNAFSFI